MTGLVLSDDLLFASRLTATARAIGARMAVLGDPARIIERSRVDSPGAVFVDVHLPGLAIGDFVTELRAACPTARIIGYGSHVATEVLRAAREAGCDEVLPRSALAERVEAELPRWLSVG